MKPTRRDLRFAESTKSFFRERRRARGARFIGQLGCEIDSSRRSIAIIIPIAIQLNSIQFIVTRKKNQTRTRIHRSREKNKKKKQRKGERRRNAESRKLLVVVLVAARAHVSRLVAHLRYPVCMERQDEAQSRRQNEPRGMDRYRRITRSTVCPDANNVSTGVRLESAIPAFLYPPCCFFHAFPEVIE